MLLERLAERDRPEGMGEIFEILVTSFSARGGGLPLESDLSWRPATDAYETEDTFVVQMDLAGMVAMGEYTTGCICKVRGEQLGLSAIGRSVIFSSPRACRASGLLPAFRSAFSSTARSIGIPFQCVTMTPGPKGGWLNPLVTFETKRKGNDGYRKDSHLFGSFGNHRRSTCTSSTAHTRRNKYHPGIF